MGTFIFFQDERFVHLSPEEMSIVEKCVNEGMGWLNNKMNAQSKLDITQDPVVKVADIIAKIQVTWKRFNPDIFLLLSYLLFTLLVLPVGGGGCLLSSHQQANAQSGRNLCRE